MDSSQVNHKKQPSYFIDLNWYQQNERAFSDFVRSRLCRKHQVKKAEDPDKLMAAFGTCCSKANNFLTGSTPLLESVFRLILCNGNRPMNLDDISQKISTLRGSSVNNDALRRMLDHDEFYGITRVPEQEAE